MGIEYICLSDNGVDLHIAKPEDFIDDNRNQYLFSFGGLEYYKRVLDNPSIVIIGDFEYQSFLECLFSSIDYLIAGAPQGIKTFRSHYIPDNVSLKFLKKPDQKNKVRLKFTFNDQVPVLNGASWKGIKKNEFAFYMTNDECQSLGRILKRLKDKDKEYDALYDTILDTRDADWAIPRKINSRVSKDSIEAIENIHDIVDNFSPELLKSSWLQLLSNASTYGTDIINCRHCKKKVCRRETWVHSCLDCYRAYKNLMPKK